MIQASRIPLQTADSPMTTEVVSPVQKFRQNLVAIPAGPMISVKTSRMPTTWLARVTEIARITMKTMDKADNETPRASARSG